MTERVEPVEVERRIVTVLFCDLADFTTLSEQLDAEDVAIVQNAYFAAVRDAVTRHSGTVEKFIGDAAVAVFGVPFSGEDDAERAVRTGLAIVGAMEQLSAGLGLEDGTLRIRVGVNTGEAVVHADPSPGEALVTGDVVNTAARLQAAAPLGAVLLGPGTTLAVASTVELEPAGELMLKGKSEPVTAARAIAVLPEPERERAMGALRAPTVGRQLELAALNEALERCVGGATSRITIVAPPGTGKSRVLLELAEVVRGTTATLRRARVRPDALGVFRPVSDLVAEALSQIDIAAGDGEALRRQLETRLTPGRASVVAEELTSLGTGFDESQAAPAGEERRLARFRAWSDGLRALCDGAEVWLVEDIHWSGRDFRGFLAAASEDVGERGRLVVCTSRPSLLEGDPEWIGEAQLISLEPLGAPSTAELVRALVGDALPPDIVDGIVDRSSGNPLFVEELIRSWVSTGLLERLEGTWRLRSPLESVDLPATVQGIYAAQLDDLPPAARVVVRRASVAGRQFPVGALSTLDAVGPDGVETLVRQSIVRGPVPDALLGESFVFRHALIRDVGYASLSRAERARLHIRMARWLEQVGAARPDEIAEVAGRHYAAAIDAAPTLAAELGDGLTRDAAAVLAAAWFERAANAALSASAYDAAGGLFERALELTAPDRLVERGRLLTGVARAIAYTSNMDSGLAAAEEALALFLQLTREGEDQADAVRDELAFAASLTGNIYMQQLRFEDAVELAEQLIAELGGRDDDALLRLLLLRIRSAGMIGDEAWRQTAGQRERALTLARALGEPELELETRMQTVWDESDPASAWAEIERLAEQLGRWLDIAEARRARAALCLPDDLAGTLEISAQLAAFASSHQLEEAGAWADYYAAEAYFVLGEWDEALAAGVRAIETGDSRNYHRVAVRSWKVVVPIAAARRDQALLERAADWYARRADLFPDTPYGRISREGVFTLLARAGVGEPPKSDLAYLVESLAEGGSLPSWFESLDIVLADALARGDLAGVNAARTSWLEAQREYPSAGADVADALLRARLAADRKDPRAIREAAAELRSVPWPWPLLKCLRLLLEIDGAEPAEIAEVRSLEISLGI